MNTKNELEYERTTNDQLVKALANVLEWAEGKRGRKDVNPYGVPEIEAALKLLAEITGDSNYLDVDTAELSK